ncbi:MAG: hypothetical protein JXA82_16400 [Sedimentisphaerales bacterium]|nr:hypothetical protein [Sedimentisphaerales bacterium]
MPRTRKDINIVIDANVISAVFNNQNQQHMDFAPVLSCLRKGKGRFVYGGTKYINELNTFQNPRYISIFVELDNKRRRVKLCQNKVDNITAELETTWTGSRYDDHHIAAIVIVGHCDIVCSVESKVHNLVLKNEVYEPYDGVRRPSVYQNQSHRHLLQQR